LGLAIKNADSLETNGATSYSNIYKAFKVINQAAKINSKINSKI